jgi:hypothetical protein
MAARLRGTFCILTITSCLQKPEEAKTLSKLHVRALLLSSLLFDACFHNSNHNLNKFGLHQIQYEMLCQA